MIIRTAYSYTNEDRRAWWPDLRRSNHVYIVGPSGSGKSTAMVNLCHRIACGEYGDQGFAFLDPHGDTAWEDIVNTIPRHRLEHTIWFDPTDTVRPFGINLVPYAPDNPLSAEHTLEALASIWKLDQETERLVKHILIVHSYLPDSTLFDCIKMLNNSRYRIAIVEKCGNALSRLFWQTEFPLWEMTPRFRADRVGPVLSMFETLVQHPALQRIFGQPQSTVDFRQIMDSGQIMVCSLARGALGDQASRLLGPVKI
jgi:energy-coupling factor transporter ATP-binding protein EcfA2